MSIPEGVYWIRNCKWNSKVLDLDGSNTADGTKVLDWPQNETVNRKHNQLWIVERLADRKTHTIRNVHSGLVLDLDKGSTTNGTKVICWTWCGGENQKWRIEWYKDVGHTAYYHIVNVKSNTALSHAQVDSDNDVVGWSSDSGEKQQWTFSPFYWPLLYRFRVRDTGRVLDLSNGSALQGTPLLTFNQHSDIASRNQMWYLANSGDGKSYLIRCLETTTVADLSKGSSANGTPIFGWLNIGGSNQHWKVEEVDPGWTVYNRIVNVRAGTVMDSFSKDPEQKVGGWEWRGSTNQQWALEPIPTPGPSWVFIQNASTGQFLCSTNTNTVSTSEGPEHSLDYSVQWRFLEKDYTGIYTLVNRATGRVLRHNPDRTPSVWLEPTNANEMRDWWMLQAEGSLVNIVSRLSGNTLDHYGGKGIEARDAGTNDFHRSWKVIQVHDIVTSFALINGRTGNSLSARYQREEIRLTTEDAIDDFHTQWVFRKVDKNSDGPIYTITNKANGLVLGGTSARWQLIVCCERYFGVRNVTSHNYLGVDSNSQVKYNYSDMQDDRSQCWEVVSSRGPDASYDLLFLDDDILEALGPFVAGDKALDLGHHIEKRSPKKPPKGKDDWSLPEAGRVTRVDDATVRQLFEALIDRWEWDIVNEEREPIQTLVSFNQQEAQDIVGPLPRNIRNIYEHSRGARAATVFRIDRQGYITIGDTRYVNIQGQYGTDTYFHVNFPVGIRYGRETIRNFLRQSLERGTSVVITSSTCKPPKGGPPFRRDPGAGGGNSWTRWMALALLATVTHSEL